MPILSQLQSPSQPEHPVRQSPLCGIGTTGRPTISTHPADFPALQAALDTYPGPGL